MIDAYLDLIDQLCAPEVAAEIRMADLSGDDYGEGAFRIYRSLRRDEAVSCLSSYTGFLAWSVNRSTPPDVARVLFDAAATLDAEQREDLRDAMVRAYEVLPYDASNSARYFNTAALYDLEIPETVDMRLIEVPFDDHTDEAFHHTRYLILRGDRRGYEKADAALERLQPDVDRFVTVYTALSDLVIVFHREGKSAGALWTILDRYKDDERRATGVSGPGTGPSAAMIHASKAPLRGK